MTESQFVHVYVCLCKKCFQGSATEFRIHTLSYVLGIQIQQRVLYGSGSGTGSGTIDQDAHAFLAGVRYDLPDVEDDSAPWVDVSCWDYSGDSDSTDNSNGNFVSYEFNNDTIVLEDSYYGLDLDTNYRAFKVKGGMNLSPEWSIQGTFAYFTLNSNAGGFASNPSNNSKKLGDEFDVRATYRATDFLTFHLNAGTLQNAKALGVGSGIEVFSLTSEVRF